MATRIARLAVGQQSYRAGAEVVTIFLVIFVAAGVFAEDKVIAPGRLITRVLNTVLEKSDLRPCAAWKFDQMNLVRVGEARHDEHLAPDWMPTRHPRAAELRITADLLR